ncbi:hypothetical protein [Streptomyces sp. NPDC059788]|uniref:hypothetical protein n=1 Tax=Streptomyces sp. NPDC059788 TaxID=3346948 RepID=UPI00365F5E23
MEEPRQPVTDEAPGGPAPDAAAAGGAEPEHPESDRPQSVRPESDGQAPDRAASDPSESVERQAPDGPAGPQPLGVAVTPTGDAAVDAQLRRLADADHLAASGHLEVYEDVHRGLRDALAALDQRPGPAGPSGAPRPPQPSATYDNRS